MYKRREMPGLIIYEWLYTLIAYPIGSTGYEFLALHYHLETREQYKIMTPSKISRSFSLAVDYVKRRSNVYT